MYTPSGRAKRLQWRTALTTEPLGLNLCVLHTQSLNIDIIRELQSQSLNIRVSNVCVDMMLNTEC